VNRTKSFLLTHYKEWRILRGLFPDKVYGEKCRAELLAGANYKGLLPKAEKQKMQVAKTKNEPSL